MVTLLFLHFVFNPYPGSGCVQHIDFFLFAKFNDETIASKPHTFLRVCQCGDIFMMNNEVKENYTVNIDYSEVQSEILNSIKNLTPVLSVSDGDKLYFELCCNVPIPSFHGAILGILVADGTKKKYLLCDYEFEGCGVFALVKGLVDKERLKIVENAPRVNFKELYMDILIYQLTISE